jgi:hypothetical protein
MAEAKPKVVVMNRSPEEAEALIEHLKTQVADLQKQREGTAAAYSVQLAQMQKKHQEVVEAERKVHNEDAHRRNEAHAAIQQKLMAAQDLICKLQDRLLNIRQVSNQPV